LQNYHESPESVEARAIMRLVALGTNDHSRRIPWTNRHSQATGRRPPRPMFHSSSRPSRPSATLERHV